MTGGWVGLRSSPTLFNPPLAFHPVFLLEHCPQGVVDPLPGYEYFFAKQSFVDEAELLGYPFARDVADGDPECYSVQSHFFESDCQYGRYGFCGDPGSRF